LRRECACAQQEASTQRQERTRLQAWLDHQRAVLHAAVVQRAPHADVGRRLPNAHAHGELLLTVAVPLKRGEARQRGLGHVLLIEQEQRLHAWLKARGGEQRAGQHAEEDALHGVMTRARVHRAAAASGDGGAPRRQVRAALRARRRALRWRAAAVDVHHARLRLVVHGDAGRRQRCALRNATTWSVSVCVRRLRAHASAARTNASHSSRRCCSASGGSTPRSTTNLPEAATRAHPASCNAAARALLAASSGAHAPLRIHAHARHMSASACCDGQRRGEMDGCLLRNAGTTSRLHPPLAPSAPPSAAS
jgi:hypothetical protein